MYYEEEVIDNILHWRGTPDGEWIPKTLEELTNELLIVSFPFSPTRRVEWLRKKTELKLSLPKTSYASGQQI